MAHLFVDVVEDVDDEFDDRLETRADARVGIRVADLRCRKANTESIALCDVHSCT
jgi:hypothetical protein